MYTPPRVHTPKKRILQSAKKFASQMCWEGENTQDKASLLTAFAKEVLPKSRHDAQNDIDRFIVESDWHSHEDKQWASNKLEEFMYEIQAGSEEEDGRSLIIKAMTALSQDQANRRDQRKIKERARNRIQGQLKGGGVLELARYLKSAYDEFDNDYLEAARFIQETSIVARKVKLSKSMWKSEYRSFCFKILEQAHPQTHHVLGKAAETLAPQQDGESVQSYIERCEEDSGVLAFSLKCAKSSVRERHTLFSTSVTTAINGLHHRLQSDLVITQKEQLMQNQSCSWNTIRIKAGACEDTQ